MTKTLQESEEKPEVAPTDPKSKKIKKTEKLNTLHPLNKKYRMRIEGHRGAGLMEPENTIKAFEKAIELELDGVELDVWLTKDDVPVVVHGKLEGDVEFHDKNEKIENMTLEEVKTTPMKTGEVIPTLKEVLETCKGKVCVNIELKGNNLHVAEKVVALVHELEMFEQISVSSFHHPYYDALELALEKLKIQQRVYFGFRAYKPEGMPDFTKGSENDSLNLDIQLLTTHREVTLEGIRKAKEKNFRLKFYFPMKIMETDEYYDEMLGLDTDTVITNHPVLLKEYLMKKEKEVEKIVDSPLAEPAGEGAATEEAQGQGEGSLEERKSDVAAIKEGQASA